MSIATTCTKVHNFVFMITMAHFQLLSFFFVCLSLFFFQILSSSAQFIVQHYVAPLSLLCWLLFAHSAAIERVEQRIVLLIVICNILNDASRTNKTSTYGKMRFDCEMCTKRCSKVTEEKKKMNRRMYNTQIFNIKYGL